MARHAHRDARAPRRFGGGGADEGHTEELRGALRHMEEPGMLAETVTRWRQEALDEGMRQGMSEGMRRGRSEGMRQGRSEGMRKDRSEGMRKGRSEGLAEERTLLRRLAARRFGVETGDALAALLANEQDVERLAEVGELMMDCANPEELLRRGGRLLNGRG